MNIKNVFALLAGTVFSIGAIAADNTGTPFISGERITNDAAGCSLLAEAVQINLSNGVYGSYACNTASNRIGVATCHPNGQKGAWTVDVLGPDPEWEDPGDGSTAPIIKTGEEQRTGGRAYVVSTAGGRVNSINSVNCRVTGGDVNAEAATISGL
ncbi:hypothetical protein [Stutzerimonas frequens]|uniref:hypothetical protein n=1 Tax=Stutzerimonas frequens TaxID=2968969 RepID=UPI0012686D6E|nr:hypothetical protein [Stutzerimonas frequens]|tara:strand:+ start:3906 stop:4370 length:465 start_codon:yes stop_codon:yes gene_type:complete